MVALASGAPLGVALSAPVFWASPAAAGTFFVLLVLAELAAAAHVGDGIDRAAIEQAQAVRAERRAERDAVGAVAVGLAQVVADAAGAQHGAGDACIDGMGGIEAADALRAFQARGVDDCPLRARLVRRTEEHDHREAQPRQVAQLALGDPRGGGDAAGVSALVRQAAEVFTTAPRVAGSSKADSLIGLPAISSGPVTGSSTVTTMLRARTCGSSSACCR